MDVVLYSVLSLTALITASIILTCRGVQVFRKSSTEFVEFSFSMFTATVVLHFNNFCYVNT